jgi:hypothetical protein
MLSKLQFNNPINFIIIKNTYFYLNSIFRNKIYETIKIDELNYI